MPFFVTMPILAHISCTEASTGKASIATHSVESPYLAPACEKVVIAEGSSSLAPEINPGPRAFQNLLKSARLGLCLFMQILIIEILNQASILKINVSINSRQFVVQPASNAWPCLIVTSSKRVQNIYSHHSLSKVYIFG